MYSPRPLLARTSLLVLPLALCSAARAQDPLSSVYLPLPVDSGPHENNGTQPEVVLSFPVEVEGAAWMQLEFADVQLAGDVLAGTGAILRITSLHDGAVQELNTIHVQQWRKSSAYFNGGSLLVEVVAQPGTGASRVVLAAVETDLAGAPESICGPTDDRVLSNDNRAGRLLPIGCTGWTIDDCNSCQLTAGHCSTASLQTLQFNVPLSTSSGSLQHPGPQDQYAVDTSSLQTNGGQGTGNDWGYFGVFPNSNTGLTPFQAYGVRYHLALPPPFNAAQSIRITGYGTRSTPPEWNQVQETHVGPWVTLNASLVQYQTDTTGGNSGSPVIHEPSGNAIGIHTHGGCSPSGGQNSGTASNHSGLQSALSFPIGVCAGGISVVGGPPTSLNAGQSKPVTIQVGGVIVPGSAKLHYRYAGGNFVAQTMSANGPGLYTGTLPAPQCGDTPQFYFSVDNSSCGLVTQPNGAPNNFYSATVGGVEVQLFADNFQSNTGWTPAVAGATSGAWERGVPINDPGWQYDPLSDGDGSGACFLTQNAVGNTDVDNGAVTLTSPALDMAGGSCVVRYRYYLYLSIEDGADRLLVEMSSNGTAGPWVTVATHATNNSTSWTAEELTAAEIAAAGLAFTSDMRVRFTANDGGTQSIVESGVDGVQVARIACSLFQNYCTSGAAGSVISATGSSSLAADNLVLHASQVPSNKMGQFFYSLAKQNTPFGDGTRCAGSPAIRLPLVSSGAGTTLDFALHYASLPPAGAIQAGDLWNFQCWFRDGALPIDLSNGLQVVFVP